MKEKSKLKNLGLEKKTDTAPDVSLLLIGMPRASITVHFEIRSLCADGIRPPHLCNMIVVVKRVAKKT